MTYRYPQHRPMAPVTLPASAVNEALGMLFGPKLGSGAFRDVYQHATDPTLVVKFEHSCNGRFCNIDEWNLWTLVIEKPEIARWFAPVHFVSANGQILIQERTDPLVRLPKQVPHFVNDVKLANMGRLRGRPVFHDYANTKIETLALKCLKLVDAS